MDIVKPILDLVFHSNLDWSAISLFCRNVCCQFLSALFDACLSHCRKGRQQESKLCCGNGVHTLHYKTLWGSAMDVNHFYFQYIILYLEKISYLGRCRGGMLSRAAAPRQAAFCPDPFLQISVI